MTSGRISHITMFKRCEHTITDDYCMPAKRVKFDPPKENSHYDKTRDKIAENRNTQYDDLWGDDFAEEDIEEMDVIASQENVLDNLKLSDSSLHSLKSRSSKKPTTIFYNETSHVNMPISIEKADLRMIRQNIQGTSRESQDVTEINYSQFRNKLIDKRDYNSTFQNENNLIVSDGKELEKLKNKNKKLLNDFITKDGETVFLRQQLQQIQLRAENEKLEKMRLIEEQADRHRSDINKICKEKEQLKTQLELQNLEIENLLERCKLLESGNIKLKEPQTLYVNALFNKSRCNMLINRQRNMNQVKEVCTQVNTLYKKSDYRLKTCNTYFPVIKISELIFEVPLPEKSIINVKVLEKTGKRNLPILQEEETFRIFENPDLVKPVITIVDEKILTTEFVLLEIAAIEQKMNTQIESEKYIPIINKLVLTTRELMLNVAMVLRTIFQAMTDDDIRDMNDLYFSTVYENQDICIKSECEAHAWHEGEYGIEARRLLAALSHISLESSYLSKYLAGKSSLCTYNDKCYNRYLQQMIRYNAWPKKNHKFEMLEIILECVTLIGHIRRSHQFTGLINAIIKVLCNVQQKVGYCEKGLEYVHLIFKELVFSRPLSLCYVSLAHFIMLFSKCNKFIPKLCRNSHACVLQILIAQMEYFYPDFITTINMTHALMSSIWYSLQMNNNFLRTEDSELCNCYIKLLRFTINMLKKCSENRLDIIPNTEWQDPFDISKKGYVLKKINYKEYICQIKCGQNMGKYSAEMYPEKLDQNFWLEIKKIQHNILRQGIRFFCYLAICDPDFVIRSPDIEDSFHLFIENVAFFDNLILQENEREALDRIKTTFIIDKSMQNESESHRKDICVSQLGISHFKKKILPTAKRDHIESNEDYTRTYMAIKALYNCKTDCKNN